MSLCLGGSSLDSSSDSCCVWKKRTSSAMFSFRIGRLEDPADRGRGLRSPGILVIFLASVRTTAGMVEYLGGCLEIFLEGPYVGTIGLGATGLLNIEGFKKMLTCTVICLFSFVQANVCNWNK